MTRLVIPVSSIPAHKGASDRDWAYVARATKRRLKRDGVTTFTAASGPWYGCETREIAGVMVVFQYDIYRDAFKRAGIVMAEMSERSAQEAAE